MKYLVIRFRQMGDAVIATCLLNSIKENDPQADVTFVLNQKIEPLFRGHPSIDHIITFTERERHSLWRNFGKMWRVVRRDHYDVIIDMRSTVNTMGFALFSPSSRYRIGLEKSYTRWVYNHRIHRFRKGDTAISHDLDMLRPLGFKRLDPHISLSVTDDERRRYARYLQEQGIDLARPIVLVGVSAKLDEKRWPLKYMAFITQRLIARRPEANVSKLPNGAWGLKLPCAVGPSGHDWQPVSSHPMKLTAKATMASPPCLKRIFGLLLQAP